LIKKRFGKVSLLNLKRFYRRFGLLTAFPLLLHFSSFSSGGNLGSVRTLLRDSSGTDTTGKILATDPIKDSSKLFASLLSPDEGRISNFSVNPQAKLFVDDYIRKHNRSLNNMKVWGKPYFNLYDHILSSYGVPVQLKYLSVIESSLSSNAISWAGAVGPWQIMEDAAREHGLRTGYYDDRLDYIKSTNAAAQILKQLYSTYGDWLLVIAAYNCGTGNVNQAIAKGRSRNFWQIQYYLPEETRNHVKKFIATHYFFEGDGSVVTMTASEAQNAVFSNAINKPADAYMELVASCATINIYGKYNSVVIANTLMMDITVFNQLNPNIDTELAKGGIYPLRIPADKVSLFQAKKIEILKQSVELFLNQASVEPAAGSK